MLSRETTATLSRSPSGPTTSRGNFADGKAHGTDRPGEPFAVLLRIEAAAPRRVVTRAIRGASIERLMLRCISGAKMRRSGYGNDVSSLLGERQFQSKRASAAQALAL